jgi:HPt (histidine-containing phosphotransfer) domain-containing protein
VGDWLAGGDRDAVRRAAHRLKGSSASLGANEFARLCSQLADTGDLPDRSTTELLAAIRSELDRIWRALEQRNAHR